VVNSAIFAKIIFFMPKKFAQHLIALAVFLFLAAIFNAPVFKGKALQQNDIMQHRGSAAEVIEFREEKGEQILWTNAMFSGMPAYLISAVYGGELLKNIPRAINAVLNHTIGYLFLLMVGFYLLTRALALDYRVGIFGAIAYGFSTYFIIVLAAGHNAKIHAMAYVPGMLAGMIWAYRQHRLGLGAAVFGLFLGLELSARHPQMLYYFLFVAIGYGIYEVIQHVKNKQLTHFAKATALLLVAAALGVLSNLPYLSNTYTYGKYSIRGKSELTLNKENKTEGLDRDYATAWSYGIGETFTLLVPNFKGGATEALQNNPEAVEAADPAFRQNIAQQNSYYGDQPFTSGPVYAGAVVILLACLAFFYVKGGFKYVLLLVAILTTALSWGKNMPGLTNFFLDNVPFYNKFRAVASILVIPEFILPVLAVLGLSALSQIKNWQEKIKLLIGPEVSKQKMLYYGSGALAGLCLLMYLAPTLFTDFLSSQEQNTLNERLIAAGLNNSQASNFISSLTDARQVLFKTDVLRTLFYLIAASLVLVLYSRKALKTNVTIVLLAVLVGVDLFTVNKRYLNEDSYVREKLVEQSLSGKVSAADRAIMQQYNSKDPYFRTLNLTVSPFNDATTSFHHYSIGGYHGAKLKIYQELIENKLGAEIERLQQSLQQGQFSAAGFSQLSALNMLNTRYLIVNPQAAPIENPARLGNAWLVKNLKTVATADAEILALKEINPATTAVLRESEMKKVESLPANAGQGSIKLTSYHPEKLVYQYQSTTENLAVFSEIWYPENWVATIDGKEVPIARANYVLRALKVPAGQHTITFAYNDTASGTANTMALAASVLLILALPAALFFDSKREQA
jgi:hypothetical protein